MIPVTRPFLPPRETYEEYLKGIWARNWLTNHGPLVTELEIKLKQYLSLNHLLFLSNGTIALQIAIKALKLKGEVITTPFSYVATTSSLIWEGCSPVFVDIDPDSLTIDPTKIEEAITKKTSGILATHVYGNPCNIEAIREIAEKHNLKVIYDAAHCFGVKYKGKSVFEYGDISTASFHATKVFHTIEGGAVITKEKSLFENMSYLRNFGHESPYEFELAGINGKNSEFHAAMGLCNLNYIEDIIAKRKILIEYYLQKLQGFNLRTIKINQHTEWNFSYFPIILENEPQLQKTAKELEKYYIYTRRYFFPSLNNLSYYRKKSNVPNSDSIAPRVLCLPLYNELSIEEIDMITQIIYHSLNF